MRQKGLLFVISGPSGSGKNTVIKEFLKRHKRDFTLSISATTRAPRAGEKEGVNYYFYSKAKFRDLARKGMFLEYARVLDNYYGTPASKVQKALIAGKHVIMDIDIQGAAKIRSKTRDCVTIFIIPPTVAELAKRLKKRKTETRDAIKKRLALARKELKERSKYDYIVINKDLKKAVSQIESILELENSRRYKI